MSTREVVAVLVVAAGVAAAPPTSVSAQGAGPGRVSGSAEVGRLTYAKSLTDLQLGKFEEYKQEPAGLLLRALRLLYDDSAKFVWLSATDLGQRDASGRLRAMRPGSFDAQLKWDRIPHTFSTTARSVSPNVYSLPDPRPDTATINRAPYIGPIRTIWDPLRASVMLTPSAGLDLKAEYTSIAKNGSRPMGMPFGSPGSNAREILEPIDQTVQDIRLTESYARSRYQLMLTYAFSRFENRNTSVTADNMLLTTSTATTGSSQGRSALFPNNNAHTVLLNGALSLPWRSRITGNTTLSWRRQNEPFIPVTINSAITDPRIADVPKELGGSARTELATVTATSHPLQALTLRARFRNFAYRDQTAPLDIPVLVINDRSVANGQESERRPFSRTSGELSASWKLFDPISLGAGFLWERWERDSTVRNVHYTNERTPRLTLDVNGLSWVQFRSSYSKGWRRGTPYVQNTTNQLPEQRRFDEADRNRERFEVFIDVFPIDQVTLTSQWGFGNDSYPNSLYGLQADHNRLRGADIAWTPTDRLSLGAGVTREEFRNRQRSRSRQGTMLANLTYDWVANNRDLITTYGLDFKATLVPKRFEVGGSLDASRARMNLLAKNPQTPTGGTTAQNTSATAVDFPQVKQTFSPSTAFVRYLFSDDWAFSVNFYQERFDQTDFRTDALQPAIGSDVYLANDFLNYNAKYLTFTFAFRPRALRIGRSAL